MVVVGGGSGGGVVVVWWWCGCGGGGAKCRVLGAVGCKLPNRSINNFRTLFLCPKVMDFFDKIRGGRGQTTFP